MRVRAGCSIVLLRRGQADRRAAHGNFCLEGSEHGFAGIVARGNEVWHNVFFLGCARRPAQTAWRNVLAVTHPAGIASHDALAR